MCKSGTLGRPAISTHSQAVAKVLQALLVLPELLNLVLTFRMLSCLKCWFQSLVIFWGGGGFEVNGAQVPSLLHTQVHQVGTEPPCQLRGAALDLEYCAGASGLPSKAWVWSWYLMSWGTFESKWLDMSDLSTSN